MKSIPLVALLIFIMLLSCKCKKVPSDATVAQNEAVSTPSKIDAASVQPNVADANTIPVQEDKSSTSASDATQKQESGMIAEYEANTRGFFIKIKFANNQLTVYKERDNTESGKTVAITKEQAAELTSLLKAVNTESLPKLKWPTEKRYYDGAAHANLVVISNGKTYTGAGFDHGYPPKEIEKFVKKLVSLAEKE